MKVRRMRSHLNLEEGKLPEPILMHKSLEEKVDYLLQQFEEQKTIEALKFKVFSTSFALMQIDFADHDVFLKVKTCDF